MPITPAIRAFMAEMGRKGGQTRGKSKVRGNSAYYARIAKKRGKRK